MNHDVYLPSNVQVTLIARKAHHGIALSTPHSSPASLVKVHSLVSFSETRVRPQDFTPSSMIWYFNISYYFYLHVTLS